MIYLYTHIPKAFKNMWSLLNVWRKATNLEVLLSIFVNKRSRIPWRQKYQCWYMQKHNIHMHSRSITKLVTKSDTRTVTRSITKSKHIWHTQHIDQSFNTTHVTVTHIHISIHNTYSTPTYIYMYIYIYKHTHTHTYIHIYMCVHHSHPPKSQWIKLTQLHWQRTRPMEYKENNQRIIIKTTYLLSYCVV